MVKYYSSWCIKAAVPENTSYMFDTTAKGDVLGIRTSWTGSSSPLTAVNVPLHPSLNSVEAFTHAPWCCGKKTSGDLRG